MKQTFAAQTFAADTFSSGAFRGVGVNPPGSKWTFRPRTFSGQTFSCGTFNGVGVSPPPPGLGSKWTFRPKTFASRTFASGTFRGVGVNPPPPVPPPPPASRDVYAPSIGGAGLAPHYLPIIRDNKSLLDIGRRKNERRKRRAIEIALALLLEVD